MEVKDWKNRELEKEYVKVFILEEETTGNYKIMKTIQGLDPKVSTFEIKLEPGVISGK